MREITVTMSKAAYEFYEQNWNDKGKKRFSKEALIQYIDKTGGYMGTVVDIAID